ncbi:hypothetical protein EMMF5_004579 [Cystobasidiomycetes sp. EMM_F5]
MNTFISRDKGKQPAFQGSTLILPIVSLANVAQLAADLLIHTLQLERIGALSGRNHVPLVAPQDYVHKQINGPLVNAFSTAVEVFQSRDGKITLIQQRSPVIKSRKDAFVASLIAFVQQAHFSGILVMAGTDPSIHRDFDNPSPFRYITLKDHKLATGLKAVASRFVAQPTTSANMPLISAGGITRRLLSGLAASMQNTPEIEVACLLMFVVEGDNRQDAHVLARTVSKTLDVNVSEDSWREPVSWKTGLYGTQVETSGSDRGVRDLYS